jgi:hypothetical protein
MGQDMNEYIAVLEESLGEVVAEDWLLTSADGMYLDVVALESQV